MPEPRNDMFPDQSSKDQGVSENVTTQQPVVAVKEETITTATQEKGAQTPDNHLYAALKEERERRKSLEERLGALESNSQSSNQTSYEQVDEVYSDEGKLILQQLEPLKQKISSLEDELEMEKLMAKFPQIQGLKDDFESYKQDFPRHKLENVAKLFLQEQGIFEQTTEVRQGLESATKGPKSTETSDSFSPEEIDRLRTQQPRLFIKMIREGAIDPDKIKVGKR